MRILWKNIAMLGLSALALGACAFEPKSKYEDTNRPDTRPGYDTTPPDVDYDADIPPDVCSGEPSNAVETCDVCTEGTRCVTGYTYDCGLAYLYCATIAGSSCYNASDCGDNYMCQSSGAFFVPRQSDADAGSGPSFDTRAPASDTDGGMMPPPMGYCVALEGASCTTHYDCSAGGSSLVCVHGACADVAQLSECATLTGVCETPSGQSGQCESICVWPAPVGAAPMIPEDPAPPCPAYCIPDVSEGPTEPTPRDCQSDEDCDAGQRCVEQPVAEECDPSGDCVPLPPRMQCEPVAEGG